MTARRAVWAAIGAVFLAGAVARAGDVFPVLIPERTPLIASSLAANGGLLIDFETGTFQYKDPHGGTTAYSSFGGMFSALGGVASTSPKWIYNAEGRLVQIPANTPAQPCYGGNQVYLGLCTENGEINLAIRSQAFSVAPWTATGVSVVDNAEVAPDGATTAALLTEDSSTGNHDVVQTVYAPPSSNYVVSCFFSTKAGTRDAVIGISGIGGGLYATFDPRNGNVITQPQLFGGGLALHSGTAPTFVERAGSSGYYRFSIAFALGPSNAPAVPIQLACGFSANGSPSYTGDSTAKMRVWGAEFKKAQPGGQQQVVTPSSYIPTTTVPVVRAPDSVTMATIGAVSGAAAYSFYTKVVLPLGPNYLWNAFFSLVSADDTQSITLTQSSPDGLSAFNMQLVGTSITSFPTEQPQRAYGTPLGLAGSIGGGTSFLLNSNFSVSSTAVSNPVSGIGKLRLGSFGNDPTNTGNVGLLKLLIMPSTASLATLESIVANDPAFSPDAVTPPNALANQPASGPITAGTLIWRGPTAPPFADTASNDQFPYYPLNVAFTQDIAAAEASGSVQNQYAWLQHGNRCDIAGACGQAISNEPNSYGLPIIVSVGKKAYKTGVSFDSYALADGATLTAAAYALGYSDHQSVGCPPVVTPCGYLDIAEGAGFIDAQVVTYATAAADASTLFTNLRPNDTLTAVDIVVLPDSWILTAGNPTPAPWGIVCECDFKDARPASETTALMAQLAALAHAKLLRYGIMPMQLLASSSPAEISAGQNSGFCGVGELIDPSNCAPGSGGPNLQTIANTLDMVPILVREPAPGGFSAASAMTAAVALFGPIGGYPRGVLALGFSLGKYPGGTTIADARAAVSFLSSNGMTNVMVTQDGAALGGDKCRYTNQKIEIVTGQPPAGCFGALGN